MFVPKFSKFLTPVISGVFFYGRSVSEQQPKYPEGGRETKIRCLVGFVDSKHPWRRCSSDANV